MVPSRPQPLPVCPQELPGAPLILGPTSRNSRVRGWLYTCSLGELIPQRSWQSSWDKHTSLPA